jgi:hypothetical protein
MPDEPVGEIEPGPEPGATVTNTVVLETQRAAAAEIMVPTPHYPLSEAEFNDLVDPPPRSHQWLPTIRGAALVSFIGCVAPLLAATIRGQPVTLSLIPETLLVALIITSIWWLALVCRMQFKPHRRDQVMRRVRKTWDRGE